jgi:hypothetical protein
MRLDLGRSLPILLLHDYWWSSLVYRRVANQSPLKG